MNVIMIVNQYLKKKKTLSVGSINAVAGDGKPHLVAECYVAADHHRFVH